MPKSDEKLWPLRAGLAGAALAGAALALAAALCAGLLGPGVERHRLDPSDPTLGLTDVERAVEAKFGAPQLSAAELAALGRDRGVVLFDVREREEYARSHIPGAVHIPPDMSAQAFAALHGDRLRGKTAVFYCAVGVRSSLFLGKARGTLARHGARDAYNLRGGIFRWHIEGRPLEAGGAPATGVHPYDEAWGALLARSR